MDICSSCSESVLGKRKRSDDSDDDEDISGGVKCSSVNPSVQHVVIHHDQAEQVHFSHEGESSQ